VVIKKFNTLGTSSWPQYLFRASKRLTCAACHVPVPVAVGMPD
jgi:hypothetical protein